jgi:hydroxypyruvate isomerase
VNRREFNTLGLGAALAPLVAGRSAFAAQAKRDNGGHTFSIMLWTLPKTLSFPQQLELVAAAGYDSVEVGSEYEKWTDEEWAANLAALKRLGLGVDAAVPGRNSLADKTKRSALRDDLIKAIPGAKRLGCKQLIYTAFKRVAGQSAEEQRAAIVDTLKYAADLPEMDGMEIVLEPIDLLEHKEEAVISVTEAFAIARAVNSPKVTVLYDFYHEQRQTGNLIEKLNGNIDLVGLVHVADVPGRHQPGTGEMNWTNIYRALAKLQYKRVICMEFSPQGDPVTVLTKAREEAIAALRMG